VLAATNQPELLDAALLRPGRFDRIVRVDVPEQEGRLSVLRLHARAVKLSFDTDLFSIARSTDGFSGAELANVINESALLAVRGERREIAQEDLQLAVRRQHVSRQISK
jgi:cell division protease FtsH